MHRNTTMPGSSSRVRRLEKEAILRAKDREYTREQSNNYISKLGINFEEDEDTERHRRHITTRPIRQIQREVDYPVETMEKITERIQQELKRRQMSSTTTSLSAAAAATPTSTTPTTRNYHSSLSSSSTDDRTNRDSGLKGKYTSNKHNSSGKIY